MPPNFVDPPMEPDVENEDRKEIFNNGPQAPPTQRNSDYYIDIFQSSLNLLAHVLIGVVVGGSLMFAVRDGLPLTATPLHIVLCVIGYQLLMAQAILSLSPNNGWTRKFTFLHKRRAHWILQIGGSVLAIVGSFIKILDKTVHWDTYHGQMALVALVFTSVSLVNGLVSLYANELRRLNPRNSAKITHICFGTIAFSATSICLCFGIDKGFFRNWATNSVAITLMSFIGLYSFIIITNPFLNLFRKSKSVFRR